MEEFYMLGKNNEVIKMKIDIFDILKDNKLVYAKLNSKFLIKLENEIKEGYGTLKEFNRDFLKINYPTLKYIFGRKAKTHKLNRICRISKHFGIEDEILYKNITGFEARGSTKKDLLKLSRFLEIDENFVEGYALYLAEGDTGLSGNAVPKKLRLTNSEFDVIKHFCLWLRRYFPYTKFYLRIINSDKNKLSTKKIKEIRKELKLTKNEITTYKGKYNKMVKYVVCCDYSIIIDLILKLDKIIKEFTKRNKNLSRSYIRGMMIGEGTTRKRGYYRYVRIEMKNKREIDFISKLLSQLDIRYSKYSRSERADTHWIHIGNIEDIIKFRDLIGFGIHKKRQKILEECIKSYKQDHFRKGEANKIYIETIENLMEKYPKGVSTRDLSKHLNRSQNTTAQVLLSLYKKDQLKRERDGTSGFRYKPINIKKKII